jgi:oxepin-CoA hydrolase/3-oxo-5,6-dehydrosuberyl-CoA semialdehyde dehydrogenase
MEIKKFITEDCIKILKTADQKTTPSWGTMTFHHMVEHLTLVISISCGKKKVDIITPPEKIQRNQNFLASPMPLPKEFKAPFLPTDITLPIVHKNLDHSLGHLIQELNDFYSCFKTNPEATFNHPIFGALNKTQWELFHQKHFTHHLGQFNLL